MLRTITTHVLGASLVVLISACSVPVISDPADTAATGPKGTVLPLDAFLPADSRTPVKLIFVHGVGDHCAGYALGKEGWLSEKVLDHIGLVPDKEDTPSSLQKIYSSVFIPLSKVDEKSYVSVWKKHYRYRLPSSKSEFRSIEAIEITWSSLTQWIKTNQLGYDSGEIKIDGDTACVDAQINNSLAPPPREALNAFIKEQVLDRSLADSMIYAGSYGEVIRKGFAEALCHSITDQPNDQACQWPDARDARSKYIFVTHSLGSRIVFDTLLGLVGYQNNGAPTVYHDAGNAAPFVRQMMVNTPVVYMMANQLTLLGLANAKPEVSSFQGPQPYRMPIPHISALPFPRDKIISLDAQPTASRAVLSCRNPLTAAAQVIEESRTAPGQELQEGAAQQKKLTLNVVAFSDTNDLLSWAIPSQYVTALPGDACTPSLKVANVFVRNSYLLPFLVENPGAAHTGYFKNSQVWDIIRCGAKDGVITQCK